MSGLFRSEDMQFVRLTMTNEAAYPTMLELGKFGKFHMEDLMADIVEASDLYSYYKKRAVACYNWERHLRRFEDLLTEHQVPVPEADIPLQDIAEEDVLSGLKSFLEPLEKDLDRNIEYKASEDRSMNELKERSLVLQTLKIQLFSANAEVSDLPGRPQSKSSRAHEVELDNFDDNDLSEGLLKTGNTSEDFNRHRDEEKGAAASRFHNYICGAMPLVQQGPFERMLFRMSRGNAYARFFPLEEDVRDPQTGEMVKKAIFYVVYVGKHLQRRISKMCDYFRGNIHNVPDTPELFDAELVLLARSMQEKGLVLQQTEMAIQSTLRRVAWDNANGVEQTSPLRNWQEALRKEKMICDALKKCQTPNNRNLITSEGWVPSEDIEGLRAAVNEAVRYSGAQPALVQTLSTSKAPPTYFKLNDFTSNFQSIVDTYGVPRYKEVNPGLFTIITFPFLFGIMYGDVGHASVMFMFALYIVINQEKFAALERKKQLGEIFSMIFGGRYLILLMSFFAIYCGTVYNDTFSVPIDAWGTGWFFPCENVTDTNCQNAMFPPTKVYPYGVDPGWYNTKNELTFFNSMKMKIAVALGVTHMLFGIILSSFNHIYFHDNTSLIFEFVPQIIFMLCTFGYMIFIVILKWCIDWSTRPGSDPPNLIQTMITMFLSFGAVDSGKELYDGQRGVQLVLVLFALFSVPCMLFPKPFMLRSQHRKQQAMAAMSHGSGDEEKAASHGGGHGGGHGHGHDGEFDFSEHFIHQAIHTIEFVLGAVSNTASYLRLWALSLAHAELSNVFWEKLIMQYGVEMGNPVFLFITWGAWAGATFAVLLCMDSLECFLHALRLHWVEFQNKFFHADGYAFLPFSFSAKDTSS